MKNTYEEFKKIDDFLYSVPNQGFVWDYNAVLENINYKSTSGPYLIVNPATSEITEKELLKENAELFIKFANLDPIPEKIEKFANKYGRLTTHGDGWLLSDFYLVDKEQDVTFAQQYRTRSHGLFTENYQLPGKGTVKRTKKAYYPVIGESMGTWQAEIAFMKKTLKLWEMIKIAEEKGVPGELIRLISWKGDGTAVCCKIGLLYEAFDVNGVSQEEEMWLEDTFAQPGEIKIFKKFKVGEIIVPGKYFLMQRINIKLSRLRYKSLLKWSEGNDPEEITIPEDLLSAMWFQMRQACAGKTKFKKCGYCTHWMDVTEARSNKEYHEACSRKEINKNYYQSRKKTKKDGEVKNGKNF
jgi:hypothetical protein